MKCTREDIERAKKYDDVTPNGVAFEWSLANSDGARFILYQEKHHSKADIDKAMAYLRSERDVVGRIKVYTEVQP